jgi:Family of unknown function (DUF6134)
MLKAFALVLLVAPLVGRTAPGAAVETSSKHWHFAVSLDGKRIGEHDFVVARNGENVDVDIHARFKVRAAFIPLYGYDHRDHEVWNRGCLTRMDSQTNDDGKRLAVHGLAQGAGFEVQGPHGETMLPACVKSFAYWDKSFLTEPRLLNSQTGEYEAVYLTRHGVETFQVRGRSLAAEHYSLRSRHFGIDLWYSSEGEWVALESHLENGRTLRYEIEQQ